jgi:signal transduction histidine kinase
LAIARRAMEAHGGAAWAENNPGRRGLTVKLWLPVGEGDPR